MPGTRAKTLCECGNEKTAESKTCWDCFAARGPRHDPDVKAEALRLHRQGLSRRTISTELGIPDATIHDWVTGRKGPPAIPTADTCDECGEALVEPAELCGWCREMREGGVPMPEFVDPDLLEFAA